MSEIEITLPTVAYGNVKVRATPEELGMDISDAGALGHGVAIYLNLFSQGFKVGSGADVEWSPQGAVSAPQGAAQSEVDRVIDETLKAAQILADGLGGVTEVPGGPPNQHPDDGPEESGDAPWNQKVDVPKKPWETDEAAGPGMLDEAW